MTSLDKKEFEELCNLFEDAWDEYKKKAGYHGESRGGRKAVLEKSECRRARDTFWDIPVPK
jgi:hypothetical protein